MGFWRRVGAKGTFWFLGIFLFVSMTALYPVRDFLLGQDLGTRLPAILTGLPLIVASFVISSKRRKHLSFRTLAGVPEVAPEGQGPGLLQEGIYGRIRHPRYVEFTEPSARADIASQIAKVVSDAGPIHQDDLLTLIREAWGLGRAGSRIRDAFQHAVAYAEGRDRIELDGEFLVVPGQEIYVRVPQDEFATARKVRSVAPAELQLALVKLLEDAGAASRDDLRTAWARLFGWRRVGADIELAFDDAVDALVRQGRVSGVDLLTLASD